MNLDPIQPDPKRVPKSFQQLLREAQPKLDQVPAEMQIAPRPPSEAAEEDVKKYLREKMGLTPPEIVSNWIFVANECVDRTKIAAGRIGEWDKLNVFAILCLIGKRLKVICVYPRDGIDPFMVGKGVMWGLAEEIPHKYAQSEIVEIPRFFDLKTIKLESLTDLRILEKFKTEYSQAINAELTAERSARKSVELRANKLSMRLEEELSRSAGLKAAMSNANERAYRWQMATIGAMCLVLLCPVILRVAGIF